jgi:NADH-quinone oxidoreductase subunit N
MKSLIILSGLGLAALVAELVNLKKFLTGAILAGLLLAIAFTLQDWNTEHHYFNNMLIVNNYTMMFTVVLCITGFLWTLLAGRYLREETNITDQMALAMFALTGAFVMVAYGHMSMLFLGIEIMSLSFYVLAGSRKNDLYSNEAALKYFLMGSFASGFILFGIALIYGVTGSFHLDNINNYSELGGTDPLFLAGIVMILVGMAFKVSAAPFHFWAPDVYYGSPSIITALMSTVGKIAAFAAFVRLFQYGFGYEHSQWMSAIIILSILSMFVGNISALVQQNVKRMLVFSGVAHAGYLLIGISSQNQESWRALVFYTLGYSIATLMAFGAYELVSRQSDGNGDISSFNGLVKRSPLTAAAMTVAMLSFAGIPPLAGFFGKYFIFSAAVQNGHFTLVILAVVASVISLYYYLGLIMAMFAKAPAASTEIKSDSGYRAVFILGIILLVLLGLGAEYFLHYELSTGN